MSIPKILIVVPAYQLYAETIQSVLLLQWPAMLDVLVLQGDVPGTDRQRITAKYNHARDLALQGAYDALLTVEADMIVPPDALQRLWATGGDIAYGLYAWRHEPLIGGWNCYGTVNERTGWSLSMDRAQAQRLWGQVVRVEGVGLGCTLIRRQVLLRLPFRHSEEAPPPCHCDWFLARDATRYEFTQCMDLGVVCGHIRPDGQIVWPDASAPALYRLQSLEGYHREQATR